MVSKVASPKVTVTGTAPRRGARPLDEPAEAPSSGGGRKSAAMSGKQFSGAGFNGAPGLPQMDHPQAQKMAANNIAHAYETAPKHIQEAGKLWYPKVHEATTKGAKLAGISVEHAAGVVAAVSPNMDWDKNNIDAFGELHSLNKSHWDAIHKSAQIGTRTPEASAALRGKSISAAPDKNLVKAHRLMHGGEDVDTVLNAATAPKTNSFAHNIADPSNPHFATVDGRHNDIATNTMRPWKTSRGIGNSGLKTGKTTRYEHFVGATQAAAHAVGETPSATQAVAWTHGKSLERAGTTKSGQPRKVGVRRVGQGYR